MTVTREMKNEVAELAKAGEDIPEDAALRHHRLGDWCCMAQGTGR